MLGEVPRTPLATGSADLVYTGKGALIWMRDLAAWAAEIARLLRPSGHLFIYEVHPAAVLWTWDEGQPRIREDRDYFGRSHVNDNFPAHGAVQWQWRLGDVVTALATAGLEILHLGEYGEPFYRWGGVTAAAWEGRLPNAFSLLARLKLPGYYRFRPQFRHRRQTAPDGGLVDPDTVDQNYAQLEQQAQQTAAQIQTLAGKLQAAAAAGDPNAREWMLDLKEIALGIKQEQGQVSLLLQSIHSMVDNHVQNMGPQYQQGYQQQGYQQPGYQQGPGGMLQQFLGGGFGRAIISGAGFGIGDDIINKIL
jgi:hypothetical protein